MSYQLAGSAAVVLVWDGSDPPSPAELVATPGTVAVVMPIPAGWDLEALMSDPQIQVASDANVPVILDFASTGDAEVFSGMVEAFQHKARH